MLHIHFIEGPLIFQVLKFEKSTKNTKKHKTFLTYQKFAVPSVIHKYLAIPSKRDRETKISERDFTVGGKGKR
jgi:hypothetical protein